MTSKTLTDPDGDKLIIEAYPGGLLITTGRTGRPRAVRNIDPAELIAAIREVAGETDDKPEPAPAPSKSPTAEDFAKSDFARHEDGRIGARVVADGLPWFVQSPTASWGWLSDTEMAAEGWSIVTPAPSTPREALALVVDLAYEPEGDTMPDQNGNMVVVDSGEINVYSDGNSYGLPARGPAYRRLLLDPPAPVTPAWHNARIVEARVLGGGHCQWASTTDDRWVALDGSNFSVHRNYLTDVTVVVPEGGAS